MCSKYDIHLSAFQISNESIIQFESLGFVRDDFANNTSCDRTKYHGTYRGNVDLPCKELWNQFCEIIDNDVTFCGSLEEEEYHTNQVIFFENRDSYEHHSSLQPISTIQPLNGMYKACDIHISINLNKSNKRVINSFENLNVASFDKEKEENLYRIYTITTDNFSTGERVFNFFRKHLEKQKETEGKIKFEKTKRFYRKPLNAPTLPLSTSHVLNSWLKQMMHVK